MAVHDVHNWESARSEESKGIRTLLVQLGLVEPGNQTFDSSPYDESPIAFYAARGFFDEQEALESIGEHLGIEVFNLSNYAEGELPKLLEACPVNRISPSEWQEIKALPVQVSPDCVSVAMVDPLDIQAQHNLQFVFDRPIRVLIGAESEILRALRLSLVEQQEDAVELIVKGDKASTPEVASAPKAGDFESCAKDDDPEAAPVVRLVNKIFSRAIASDASDLHLTPTRDGLEVKARIDGIMQKIVTVPEGLKNPAVSRVKLLCGMDIAEKRRPQDGRLRITTNFGVKDLRISSIPSAHGENLVARILSSDLDNKDFEALGMPQEMREQLEEALKNSCKVNLVTGPTGSGKTSTLYASLLHLHDESRNIITLEDPIEYRIDGITQIQVNQKIKFGFAEGLRSILRQDPDVVLVGEIRDEETASISMKTAQTGHLVLSTLHTNSAAAAITRLRDLDIPEYLISSSLGSVLAQRLVRRVCPACANKLPKNKRDELGLGNKAKTAVGCDKCRNTGYRGRVGVYSFLQINDDVAEAIREGLSEEEIEDRARACGFKSLQEAGRKLVEEGITTAEEVERVVGVVAGSEKKWLPKHTEGEQMTDSVRPQGLITNPKILLVEDDADQRDIYGTIFESEMFDVIRAEDGRDALEKLRSETVDAVVCDVMMPNLDGYGFLKKLRSYKETKELPVLMLTAGGSEEGELESMEIGADDYLSKTSSVNILLARVKRLTERSLTANRL